MVFGNKGAINWDGKLLLDSTPPRVQRNLPTAQSLV